MAQDLNGKINELEQALLQLDRVAATLLFEKYVSEANDFSLLESVTISALERIGSGWEAGSISLSQVYMSGVICEELIERFMPQMEIQRKNLPRMAIGVLQDHHALGKRIVYSILRSGGFELMDFGKGLGVDELVALTVENQIEILLISTLMLHSALKVKSVKEKLLAAGSHTRIIVGGAPFRLKSDLWKEVGADADGKNASDIIRIVEGMLV